MKNTFFAALILAASLAPSQAWAAPRFQVSGNNGFGIAACVFLQDPISAPVTSTSVRQRIYSGLLSFFGCT